MKQWFIGRASVKRKENASGSIQRGGRAEEDIIIGGEEMEEDFWKNNCGNRPLHEAATVGNLGALKFLVEEFKERDMLVKNIYGETPLYRAAKYGQLHIVKYFLDDRL